MSIHTAEAKIAAPVDRVWEALTYGEFSAWPDFLKVTTSDDVLREGTEVKTDIDLKIARGFVISQVVACEAYSRIATSFVRAEGLPVKTEVASTLIDVSHDENTQLTHVSVELCLEFSGWKAPIIRGAIGPLFQRYLQPNIDDAGAQLAADYARLNFPSR